MSVKKKRKVGILSRLFIYMSAGFFLVLLVLLFLFLGNYWVNTRQQMLHSLHQNYQQNVQGINSKMEQVQDLSTSMAVGYALNMFQISADASVAEQLHAYSALTEYLDAVEYAMQDINIYYYPFYDAPVVHEQSRHYRPVENADWLHQVMENSGRPMWLSMPASDGAHLALARTISDSEDFQHSIGILVIQIEQQALSDSLTALAPGQTLTLCMDDGTCLVDGSGAHPSDLSATVGFIEYMQDDGQTVFMRCGGLLDNRVRLVSTVPDDYLGESLRELILWIGLTFLAAMVVIVSYAGFMSKRLVAPLVELTKSISDAAKGSFNRLEIESEQPEVQTLLTAYNTMSDRIGDLMKEQFRLGEEVNRAELMALQSQINPHFLYNTLDMVNWMAERNDKENIQRLIQAMSRFYRLALSRGSNSITIGEEIQLCETYLTIQQTRFHGRIQYEKDVDEAILNYLIPKITLQPFVENAILHGLRIAQDAGGTVSINGWMEDDRIILAVMDDGVGMSEAELKHSMKHGGSHYGMKNIRTRLSIFYKEEIPLEIESTPGAGTCVSISIPVVSKEGEHA